MYITEQKKHFKICTVDFFKIKITSTAWIALVVSGTTSKRGKKVHCPVGSALK